MARSRAGFSPLSLLEEAVHVLRRAGLKALLCHWSGSVPFALVFLFCWNSLTGGPLSDLQCAAGALALALALIWMNCRRAVYAGRLRRQLSGTPETPWTPARRWQVVSLQAFLAATKPVALLISLLVLFPFARTVAFYRTAAALSDRDDLDPLEAIRRARQLAGLEPAQSWTLLPLLLLLYLLVLGNTALTVAALPQLVRIFTGYESSFTRSGVYFLQTPLFFLFVLVFSWLLFDPYLQAVYCVRCFQGESLETGEDIRAGLRRIRSLATTAALLLAAFVFPMHAADGVAPGDLEESVRRTMEAPEYGWRNPPPAVKPGGKMPWIVTATDRMVRGLKSGLQAIGKLIVKILDWLFDHLGVRPNSQGGALPGGGLHWSLYVLILAILGGLLYVIWRRRIFQRRRQKPAAAEVVPVIRLDEEGLTADRLPEAEWLALAEQNLREENFLFALRAYYLANLAWLGQAEFLKLHPGKTDREYQIELRRRAAAETRGLFAGNIESFERAWYGRHEVTREQVEEFRDRSAAMKALQEVAA
ncbi:MAG TPA: DUF4129 domain-containing protein [Candidatus Sulfopaludibacter sp.]|jgi:hypothetical protein|nr:DUF4129 domain-containing protein [Candidatus Sulfopaludibacter sp.]